MAAEILAVKNPPGILEDPISFIKQVNNIKITSDPKAQSEFREWLLDQWPKIDSLMLKAPYGWTPPPRDWARIVKIPNGILLTEPLLDEKVFGCPRVKMSFGDDPLIASLKNKGKHSIQMFFRADSNATRNLTAVSIRDRSVELNPEGKAFLKHVGFQIKVSPTFDVRELKANQSF